MLRLEKKKKKKALKTVPNFKKMIFMNKGSQF